MLDIRLEMFVHVDEPARASFYPGFLESQMTVLLCLPAATNTAFAVSIAPEESSSRTPSDSSGMHFCTRSFQRCRLYCTTYTDAGIRNILFHGSPRHEAPLGTPRMTSLGAKRKVMKFGLASGKWMFKGTTS
jgi:hypothetical protein